MLRLPRRWPLCAVYSGKCPSLRLDFLRFLMSFLKAYPCIIDPDAATCPFGAPSVAAWSAVAKATTSTNGLPLPTSSAITALIFALLAIAIVVVKNFYVPLQYRHWVVNPVALGLAFTLPPGYVSFHPHTPLSPLIFVKRTNTPLRWRLDHWLLGISRSASRQFTKRMLSLSLYVLFLLPFISCAHWSAQAGMCAGEGIGGVINALFVIVKVRDHFVELLSVNSYENSRLMVQSMEHPLDAPAMCTAVKEGTSIGTNTTEGSGQKIWYSHWM